MFRKSHIVSLLLLSLACMVAGSCEDFLNIPSPTSKIPVDVVFSDDAIATSAVVGIYIDLYSGNGFAAGTNQSVVTLAGLSADELKNNRNDPTFIQFQSNAVSPLTSNVEALWSSMYKSIYDANSAIEGLDASNSLTPALKTQLKGEALFIRAFCYFYLINLFGDVPLAISTSFKTNNSLKRSPVSEVYDQIKKDLIMSEEFLTDAYPGSDRGRVNKSSASALLSRVYLYTGEWGRAEDKATKVIDRNDLYSLAGLNSTFLSASKEAIWQLVPNGAVGYTNEGFWFSSSIGPANNVLNSDIISAFEPGDNRRTGWTASVTSGSATIYLPNKYKNFLIGQATEYSMVLRLAEIYLIRAEARVRQNKLSSAIADIDKIRGRAGLPLFQNTNPAMTQAELMLAIERERRVELFAEWGHRWLDLKRWNRADAVLSPIKPGWSADDLLYPIPSGELSKNPNLNPQNSGY
jgi:hypothetical protein